MSELYFNLQAWLLNILEPLDLIIALQRRPLLEMYKEKPLICFLKGLMYCTRRKSDFTSSPCIV